jgi:hypothetical protein
MELPSIYEVRINYWNSKGLRKSKPGNTKAFKDILEYLKDSINGTGVYVKRKITFKMFRKAVDNYTIAVFDSKFLPLNKKVARRASLGDFLYSPFAPDPKYRYPLLHYLDNALEPFNAIHFPDCYQSLCKSFIERSGVKDVSLLTLEQLDTIALASKKLGNFYKTYDDKIDPTFLINDRQKTDMFVRFVFHQLRDDLTWFSARALTYNWIWEQFPNFCKHNGYFVTSTKRKPLSEIEEKMNERAKTRSANSRPVLKRKRPGVG